MKTARIRFRSREGDDVTLVADVAVPPGRRAKRDVALFMPGYASVRDGEKSRAFAEAFVRAGFVYLAFDPRGHGESSGTLEGLTLRSHLEDLGAAAALARSFGNLRVGIGSSLGGLTLAAHAAARPRDFERLVLVAPAFGFFERWSRVPRSQRPPALTDRVLRSTRPARTSLLASRMKVPVLIWHGMEDDSVAWRESARFAGEARSFVELRLLNRGDHRLTRWKERVAAESAEYWPHALAIDDRVAPSRDSPGVT